VLKVQEYYRAVCGNFGQNIRMNIFMVKKIGKKMRQQQQWRHVGNSFPACLWLPIFVFS
jgi:hypothetical protein